LEHNNVKQRNSQKFFLAVFLCSIKMSITLTLRLKKRFFQVLRKFILKLNLLLGFYVVTGETGLEQGEKPMISDEELLRELQNGRESALEALVHRYHRQIFAYHYRMTHNYHAAEDLTQETFWRLCKAASLYRFPQKFRPWLYTIASNIMRDYWRAAGKYDSRELSGEIISQINVEEWFERKEDRQWVANALAQLDGNHREAIILRFFQELSLTEISQVLATPLGTVKSRIHYGLKHLREKLRGGGDAEKQGSIR
jgi:RNA polymerase sigma factor (sigma-70 family)